VRAVHQPLRPGYNGFSSLGALALIPQFAQSMGYKPWHLVAVCKKTLIHHCSVLPRDSFVLLIDQRESIGDLAANRQIVGMWTDGYVEIVDVGSMLIHA
jgi:hypothetical protein